MGKYDISCLLVAVMASELLPPVLPPVATNTQHTAFYKFVLLEDPTAVAAGLRALCDACGGLLGSILVAREGINGMLAGSVAQLDQFEAALSNVNSLGENTKNSSKSFMDERFHGIVFKRTTCKTAPFRKFKIHVKAEIVPLGIDGVDARKTGIDVPPAAWRELIQQDDVVLLDNRNSFEFKLGRFKNAIDPQVTNFRDFPDYVKAHVEEWKRDGKKIAMYCTGGIRCEKTSAWMRDMDVPVYQLEGGILNYFRAMPDAERDWDGECFVFDNRIALNTKLEETDTSLEDVYGNEPDGEWRLARAKRLDEAT